MRRSVRCALTFQTTRLSCSGRDAFHERSLVELTALMPSMRGAHENGDTVQITGAGQLCLPPAHRIVLYLTRGGKELFTPHHDDWTDT